MKCEDCLYFKRDTADSGLCLKNPPQVIAEVYNKNVSADDGCAIDSYVNTVWPKVGTCDWCGCWRGKHMFE